MIHAEQLAQHVHKSSSSRLGLAVGPGHLGLGCLVNQFNHIRLRGQRLASGIVNFQQVHGVIHGMAAFFQQFHYFFIGFSQDKVGSVRLELVLLYCQFGCRFLVLGGIFRSRGRSGGAGQGKRQNHGWEIGGIHGAGGVNFLRCSCSAARVRMRISCSCWIMRMSFSMNSNSASEMEDWLPPPPPPPPPPPRRLFL